jgi:rRNA maturation endonuclease Nob1
MIRVDLAELVCIYLVVFLAAILAVWIAYEMARRVRENRSRRGWLRCRVCAMEFEDLTLAGLPRCPRCGSLNEREKLKVY